jgi:ribonuclease R
MGEKKKRPPGQGRPRGVDITGRFSASRRGFGFVINPAGPDIYVAHNRTGGAIDGDTVEVRLLARRRAGGAREGEVVRVAQRGRRTIVGRFERRGKLCRVVPSDARLKFDVYIDRRSTGEAETGDMVEIEIERYPDRDHDAHGRVVFVIGPEDSPNIDIEVIVREHGLCTEFGRDALAEAAAVPQTVGAGEIAGRRDLRDVLTVTIDGVDARDFDDAISLTRTTAGFELWTHIADVSHYVPLESALEAEASRRGTSVYLVDRVLPMLPPTLSNGICSLNPSVDRLALSVRMSLGPSGEVVDLEVLPTVIRSDHRLTYEDVDAWFEAGRFPTREVARLLSDFRDLTRVLEESRTARGGLDFQSAETKVVLAEDGTPVEILARRSTLATRLIEEAMVLTNEVVATWMHGMGAPMIYRIHEDPDPDALDQIAALIEELGYPMGAIGSPTPKTFQRLIRFAKGRPEELLLNRLLIRTMKQARYSPKMTGHFGLASETYTHFTSPIRRFPDLVVHHLVKAALSHRLAAAPLEALADSLPAIAEHSSETEREADLAERESVEVKVCEYMRARLGDVFEAVVSGVTSFGAFVELANTAQGLVHISDLDDDYYRFDAEHFQLIGEHTGRRIRLGQTLTVRLVNVSVSERRIDFVPAEGPPGRSAPKGRGGPRRR